MESSTSNQHAASSSSGVALPGKLFVGGLRSETSEGALRAHFERYGKVEEARVMYNWTTGVSRRFGFVRFADTSDARRALDEREKDNHIIDGQKVDVKQAIREEDHSARPSRYDSNNGSLPHGRKIFVGGLPRDVTDDEFRAYFENFGPIADAVILKDKSTGHLRGFGFVTFETEEAACEVLKNQFHDLRPEKKVEVKIAIPKIDSGSNNNNSGNNNNNNINVNNGKYYDEGLMPKFPTYIYRPYFPPPVTYCASTYTYPNTWPSPNAQMGYPNTWPSPNAQMGYPYTWPSPNAQMGYGWCCISPGETGYPIQNRGYGHANNNFITKNVGVVRSAANERASQNTAAKAVAETVAEAVPEAEEVAEAEAVPEAEEVAEAVPEAESVAEAIVETEEVEVIGIDSEHLNPQELKDQ